MDGETVLVKVDNLKKMYPIRSGFTSSIMGRERRFVHAVDGVSFTIERGEILGLVGESGCGKTTTGKILVRLESPTAGSITIDGTAISNCGSRQLRAFRKKVQMIFQDPYDSLDPRYTVSALVAEPLVNLGIVHSKKDVLDRTIEVLEQVELRPPGPFLRRFPHELSGGQRQRVAIARAIAANPEFIVADEPVSMLDVSIRAGVLNLMLKLNQSLPVSYLFITHDLSVARYMCSRIAVMYLGKLVEIGPKDSVIETPVHPYTRVLLSAVPVPDPEGRRERLRVVGEAANALQPPTGCKFHPRCREAMAVCSEVDPPSREAGEGRFVACHLV